VSGHLFGVRAEGANRWDHVAEVESRGHVSVDAWLDAGPGVFGHHDRHVWSPRISPSEGVMALFGLGAINKGVP
jgi:hypothetical protein